MATDIDESYIKEFYHERSRTQFRFKRISEIESARNGLRKKIETFYWNEKLIFDLMQEKKNARIMDETNAHLRVCEIFLKKHKEQTYRSTNRVLESVKNYYDETDEMRAKVNQLQMEYEPRKMAILYLANEFIQLTKMQNFQFILMPMKWRMKHDHLHMDNDGNLEELKLSILERETKNLWDRDCVNINAIIKFINEDFHKNCVKAFNSGDEMLATINNLRSKSFKALEKFTYAGMCLAKDQLDVTKAERTNETFLNYYEATLHPLMTKWEFMQKRKSEIAEKARKFMEQPFRDSLSSSLLMQMHAFCKLAFKDLCGSDNNSIKFFTTVEKFAFIERKIFDIFASFDNIPKSLREDIERDVRKERRRKYRVDERAHRIELNLEYTMNQLRRLFAKPPPRERRDGKLKSSIRRKNKAKTSDNVNVTFDRRQLSVTQEKYLEAFMSADDVNHDENVLALVNKLREQKYPLYFDHLFKKIGIQFDTEPPEHINELIQEEMSEMMFGKELLPSVMEGYRMWEVVRARQKISDIKKSQELYKIVRDDE
jgi:hypothetical protein